MLSSPILVREGTPVTPTMSPRRKVSWVEIKVEGSAASLGGWGKCYCMTLGTRC